MSVSLRLFSPILQDTGSGMDITRYITGWRRSIRGNGGYWTGDLTMVGKEADLARLFYEYLGGHFEERSNGQKTWEGMVYEMDLTYPVPKSNGVIVTRRRSLDLLYNYVYGKYVEPNGASHDLTAASNSDSITRYGRREEYLLINGVKQSPAEARRDTFLKENAWPWARVASVNVVTETNQAVLSMVVSGYVMTANWRYRTAGDGTSEGNVSDYIKDLLETDAATFLSTGKYQSNTLQVREGASQPIRAGDLAFNLVGLGDASGNPWWLYVHNDRKVVYEIIPETPAYYMHSGRIYRSAGGSTTVDPWTVKPGVFRDLTYPVRKTETGGWLDDARDFYVSEVECGTGNGLVLKTEIFDESEILAAQAEYKAQMSGGGGVTGGGMGGGGDRDPVSGRKNWYVDYAKVNKIKDIGAAQKIWQSMSLAERVKWKKTALVAWRRRHRRKAKND